MLPSRLFDQAPLCRWRCGTRLRWMLRQEDCHHRLSHHSLQRLLLFHLHRLSHHSPQPPLLHHLLIHLLLSMAWHWMLKDLHTTQASTNFPQSHLLLHLQHLLPPHLPLLMIDAPNLSHLRLPQQHLLQRAALLQLSTGQPSPS